MKNILDQIMKEQEEKKKKKEPLKCPLCGSEDIEENVFKHGSRTAGHIKCKNKDCGYFIMF